MAEKKEVKKVLELKLARKHPRKMMRLGRHMVDRAFKKFELNAEELAELDSAGGKSWFISQEVKKVAKENK